jgi:hypothetical protein
MTTSCADFIRRAQDALGGIERLRDIRTFEAHAKRRQWGGGNSTVSIWRAAGGNIRVEETSGSRTFVRLVRAGSGDDTLLREARITPRNVLAHADEHNLTVRDHATPSGARLISFPAEFALYVFDPATWLCTLVIDLLRKRRIELTDYRTVDGIATPFLERHVAETDGPSFDQEYVAITYNGILPNGIFDKK